MIQEPPHHQQPDLIEIPMADLMNPNLTKPPPDPNTTSTNLTNCKNRTTIIQIPRQNSKPRIFLLTKPAKPSLVRIATPQTVEAHKDLNSLPHHHPESNRTAPRIVRIPILARSQSKTTSSPVTIQAIQVPRKDLTHVPQEVSKNQPLRDLNQITLAPGSSQSELKLNNSLIVHQEIIQKPKAKQISALPTVVTSPATPSSKFYQVLQRSPESVKKAIKTTKTIQENTVKNLAQKKTLSEPLALPSTLASMAGIELTGADMSHTAADMSGAMPPTATVEEINVPVFIDEYLQQAAISTTAASASTPVTTQNITYNINNNNTNNNSNISNSGKGSNDEVNNCLDTFEFDIELLTENNSEDQDKALLQLQLQLQQLQTQQQHNHNHQQQQQQPQLSVDDIEQQTQHNLDFSSESDKEKQKLQLQLMLDEIMFNNNSSSNTNTNNNNQSCCNINNNFLNNNYCTNNNNNNNNNQMAHELGDFSISYDEEALFNVAPTSQNLDFDNLDFATFSATLENAVNFNEPDNDGLSLLDLDMTESSTSYFINSQPPEVMLSDVAPPLSQNLKSYTSVAALSQEILEAEPLVSQELTHFPETSSSSSHHHQSDFMSSNDRNDFVALESTEFKVNPAKRNSAQTHQHMQQKRLKLRLDTKRPKEVDAPQYQELDTPNIINDILKNEEYMSAMSPAETSMDIFNHLIDSPHETIVKSEIDVCDDTNDISPPYTPYSVNSTSNQTNFTGITNTAPNSPASSVTTRRGRGRPAKLHSDMPDISQISHLPESEKKKVLERAKNNEASRKSRLKNKERDIAIEREERELKDQNEQLHLELLQIKAIEQKLRDALKRKHFQGSPY